MHDQKKASEALISEVLDGTALRLALDSYTLDESFESGEALLACRIHDKVTGLPQEIRSRGVGLISAFYRGLIDTYAATYPSLKTIALADFNVHAKIDTGRDTARTDSVAEVLLRVANSEGEEVIFTHTSPSITRSSMFVVLQSIEFFINSERAFIAVYRALEHARRDNRPDSVARYTQQLAILVQATSYSDVIAQIRASELHR